MPRAVASSRIPITTLAAARTHGFCGPGMTAGRYACGSFEERNLVGSPEEICERIRAYEKVGVTTCAGILFVANSVPEMQETIELFGREVIPNFPEKR